MSGSIFDRERLRPVASPTQVAGVPGQPIARAQPVRAPDPMAPVERARPRRPDMSSDLASLATALSGLSPALSSLAGNYFQGVRQEEARSADADATALAIRSNAATWADAVRNDPTLADRSPFYRQMFEERLARQSVVRRGNELHAEYWSSQMAGSEDPAAIQGWLSERMRTLLDQYRDSPAQRAAAAEEVRNQALSLVRTHQQNAVRNLVARNEDSLSAAAGAAFDTYTLRGGGRSGDATFSIPDNLRAIYERVSREEGIPAHILMAQGYHESGGFSDDVLSGRRRGGVGEIGLAQVRPSTAAQPGYGVAPISERDLLDPEKAIRFQARYLNARARAAGVRDWNDPRQAMAGLAAYNGTGEGAQGYGRQVYGIAEAARGAASGGGTAPAQGGPSVPGLAAELQRLEAEARAQGVPGSRINRILSEATAAAMVRHGRLDFASLGDMARPDGTPGFGATSDGRMAMERARNAVLSRQVQEENLAYTRHRRAQEMAGQALASDVAQTMIEQITRGETPQLSPDQIRIAARVDPGLIATMAQLQNHLRGVSQSEDTRLVAELELRVNTGEADVQDVRAALGTIVRDPDTIRRLFTKALELQSNDSVFRNSAVTQMIRETQEAAAGIEGNGVLRNYGIGVSVGNAMREAAATFHRQNPTASQADLLAHLRQRQADLIGRFNSEVNLPGYAARANDANAPDPRAPAAREEGAGLVEPSPSVNWQRTRVFPSVADLETAYQAWRRNPTATTGPGAIVARWMVQGGVRDPNRFYDIQRRLLQQQEGQQRR